LLGAVKWREVDSNVVGKLGQPSGRSFFYLQVLASTTLCKCNSYETMNTAWKRDLPWRQGVPDSFRQVLVTHMIQKLCLVGAACFVLFTVGCDEAGTTMDDTSAKVGETVSDAGAAMKETGEGIIETVGEAASDAMDATKEAAEAVSDQVKEKIGDAADAVKEAVSE